MCATIRTHCDSMRSLYIYICMSQVSAACPSTSPQGLKNPLPGFIIFFFLLYIPLRHRDKEEKVMINQITQLAHIIYFYFFSLYFFIYPRTIFFLIRIYYPIRMSHFLFYGND